MRVLFYLPVITPWWFDSIVEPLIRKLAAAAEVHIVAPARWCGTGIGSDELHGCSDLAALHWHLIEGDSHPTMRTRPSDRQAIVDFVTALAPDYVLCRSADCDTPSDFPGKVRYLMEAGAAPLAVPADWFVLQDQPFDHGCLPALDADEIGQLEDLVDPLWARLLKANRPSLYESRRFRKWADLPMDRPILALPLEYEHPENFFPMHRVGATPNRNLIAELDAAIDGAFFLAITNHPLNELHIDNSALEAAVAARGSRMRLMPERTRQGASMTMALAWDAQGMIIGDSKVYSMAAFCGTPMLRRSHFKTGAWLNAHGDLQGFLAAAADGHAKAADPDGTARWFAYHVANNIIDPRDPDLTAAELLARIDRPVDPGRWEGGFARYRAAAPAQFA